MYELQVTYDSGNTDVLNDLINQIKSVDGCEDVKVSSKHFKNRVIATFSNEKQTSLAEEMVKHSSAKLFPHFSVNINEPGFSPL